MKRLLLAAAFILFNQLLYTATAYKILGIAEGASQAAIKKAYRQLALKWHPDKFNTRTPEEKQAFLKLLALNAEDADVAQKVFQEITDAHNKLMDQCKSEKKDDAVQRFLVKGNDLLDSPEFFTPNDLNILKKLVETVNKSRTVTPADKTVLNTFIQLASRHGLMLEYETIELTREISLFVEHLSKLSHDHYCSAACDLRIKKLLCQVTRKNVIEKDDQATLHEIEEDIQKNTIFNEFTQELELFIQSQEIPDPYKQELESLRINVVRDREKVGVSPENRKQFDEIKKQITTRNSQRIETFLTKAQKLSEHHSTNGDFSRFYPPNNASVLLSQLLDKVRTQKIVSQADEQELAKIETALENYRKEAIEKFLRSLDSLLTAQVQNSGDYAQRIANLIKTVRAQGDLTPENIKEYFSIRQEIEAATATTNEDQQVSSATSSSTSSVSSAHAGATYSRSTMTEAEMKKRTGFTNRPIKRLGETQQEIAGQIYDTLTFLPKELTELVAQYSYEFRGNCTATINGFSSSKGSISSLHSINLLPDGSLALISNNHEIVFWSPVTDSRGKKHWQSSKIIDIPTTRIAAVLLLPDGSLALGAGSNTISICSSETDPQGQKNWKFTKTINKNHLPGAITALILLPDGSLASGSFFGAIKIWFPTTDSKGKKTWEYKPTPEQTLEGPKKDVLSQSISPVLDNQIVLSLISLPDGSIASRDSAFNEDSGVVKIWSFNTNAQGKKAWTAQTLNEQNENIRALILLPNGSLACGNTEGDIKIWSPEEHWTRPQIVNPTGQPIRTLMVLADGSLASGDDGGCISILSPVTKPNRQTVWSRSQALDEHASGIKYMIELPGGYLASSDLDNKIKVWTPAFNSEGKKTWTCSHTFQGNGHKIVDLIGLPDGSLASGYKDGTIKIWR